MIQLLVSPTENKESANNPSVPPVQSAAGAQASWNRSFRRMLWTKQQRDTGLRYPPNSAAGEKYAKLFQSG